ncbi:MAG TPA: hypothetical protein VGK82_06415, partial [Pyrinomonadaceae bacterium]
AQSREGEADAFVRENNTKRAQNLDGVSFTIRFKDNQRQFQQGELMRLELSFASTKPHTFVVDAATYDRSGRLDCDNFVLDQYDAVVDPLYDYFHSFMGFVAGGLRSIPELTEKPEVINADLNEWLRFDKPGRYRLYVVSSRVGRKDHRGKPLAPVVSNIVEFEIVPADKKWASQQFAQAITALAKPGADDRGDCRTLRFLGIKAAVTEMIKRSRGEPHGCDFDFSFGLIGSPHRDFVIEELEKALSAPEQPVTATLLNTLTLLDVTRQTTPLPLYPEGDEQQREWQALVERRRRLRNERFTNYLRQLLAAIPQKQERARATSLQTLLESRSELANTEWSNVVSFMPDVFSRLPMDAQRNLLTSQWKPLANAAMLPVLRGILKQPEDKNDSYAQKDLRTTTLRRLYELSPEEGRRLILAEIRRPNPTVNETVLKLLPDEVMPELDSVLIENLEQTRGPNGTGNADAIASLIERYASAGISQQVRTIYEAPGAGKWACSIQASLIAYFLRVDPSIGSEYLKQALAARGKNLSRCYTSTLLGVALLQHTREVEEIATASLDDDDPEVVSHAAQVLERFGGVDSEKAIWRRFEKWHDDMQNRSEELRKQTMGVPALGAPELSGQVMIEQALRNAIVHGQSWLADPEKLKRVRELCLTDESRAELDGRIENWRRDINIYLNADGEPISITLAQYNVATMEALKQKLLQFPPGSVFRWGGVASNNEAKAQEVFQQLKTYLEDHGMKLEPEVAAKAEP